MNQDRFEKAFTEGGKAVVEGLNTMQQLFEDVHAEFVGAKAEQLRLQKELAKSEANHAADVMQREMDVEELKGVAAARMERLRRKGEINDRLVTEVDDLTAELREAKREQDRLQKDLAVAAAANAKLKAELEEIRTQRDCYAKDFFRLKRIVDGDYKGTIDTTCICEKKRNAESANEGRIEKLYRELLRDLWGMDL